MITHKMLGEHQRTDSEDSPPQDRSRNASTVESSNFSHHTRARRFRELNEKQANTKPRVNCFICASVANAAIRNAGGRPERAQAEPRHAHRDRGPDPRSTPCVRRPSPPPRPLLHRSLHLGRRLAFRTRLVARVLHRGLGLQRLGPGGLALAVLLAGSCPPRRPGWAPRTSARSSAPSGTSARRSPRTLAGERERQQSGDHGQRGRQRIADNPHALVEYAGQRQRTVRLLRIRP